MNPLIVLPLRTDKNRSQQAEGLVQRRRGRHTHACQHATLRATDMEHGRGTGASAITHPFARRVPGSHGHSCAATLCREWGPGRTQAVQRRLGWDWDSPETQAAISREGWGEQGTQNKGQEKGSITHPLPASPLVPRHSPFAHSSGALGGCWSPRQGWGGAAQPQVPRYCGTCSELGASRWESSL